MALFKIFLILVIILICFSAVQAEKYSGGTGELNNPYRIATPNDLNDIGNHIEDFNKCFVMVNDINLADYTGTQFNIIGDFGTPFTGVFDGNNHTIADFTYSLAFSAPFIALFGYVDGPEAQIKNLSLAEPNIYTGKGSEVAALIGYLGNGKVTGCSVLRGIVKGYDQVGGIVGTNSDGIIDECHADVDIRADGYTVGCLIGGNRGKVKDCSSSGSIIPWSSWAAGTVGGLIGENENVVSASFSDVTVFGDYSVGGLIGDNAGRVSDCYAKGSASGEERIGGLVGESSGGSIENCYAAGVVGGNSETGGLVGGHSGGSYTSCFWDSDVNPDVNGIGNTSDPNVIAKMTEEMQTESTFTDAGWDFVEVWDIGENQTYPFLRVHPAGDINYDDKVNFFDLAILCEHWLEGTE